MSVFLSLLFSSPQPQRGSAGSAGSSGSHARVRKEEDGPSTSDRQCWICFGEEPLDTLKEEDWVRPCRCSGTTAWVHQRCLLDWMDVKMMHAAELSDPITCPQCHTPYKVKDRFGLPRLVLAGVSRIQRAIDRGLMYATLAGLCLTGYGGLFGYGAAVLGAAMGPRETMSFFARHMNSLPRAESMVKVFLGMPMIAVSVLSGAFPSLSWIFPLIPPILYANDVIEWNRLSPKLVCLSLPFLLFTYRLAELYVPRWTFSLLTGGSADSLAEDQFRGGDGSFDRFDQSANASRDEISITVDSMDTANQTTTSMLEDERAIRVSVLSTAGVLCLPFLSALAGSFFIPKRVLPFYRMLLAGGVLIAAKDLVRALVWYQQVLIRPYRRILPYAGSANADVTGEKTESDE